MSSALPERVEIGEKESETFEEYPPEIGKQLQRAAFTEVEPGGHYIKKRTPQGGGATRTVVTATIEGGELTVTTEDVVGIIELTPETKLQINPNIDWDDILEMFLDIRRQQRSLEYQGIPIEDFLADDVQIQDIFIVITVNYLSTLEPIFRNGFIRSFETTQYDAVTGRGRIDVEQSIMNQEQGIPKQRFVRKDIDYNTPANTLIYTAGKQLIWLFQNAADAYHEQYFRIFSELRETLRELEEIGINPDSIGTDTIRGVNVNSLPRQRRYYEDAIQISKTVLSSATGESLASGHEDLHMDFILDMDSLFEQYTQIVLEEEIGKLRESTVYDVSDELAVDEKRTIHVFEDEPGHYQPDHVLRDGDEDLAVLDSKYYARDSSPLSDHDARTRMLAYAHLLDVDEMVYLTPFGPVDRRQLAPRDGTLSVVCPEGDYFSTDAYRNAVREHLKQSLECLGRELNESELEHIVHKNVELNSLEELPAVDELQIPESQTGEYFRDISQSAIEASTYENSRSKTTDLRLQLKSIEREFDSSANYLLPIIVTEEIEPAEQDEDDLNQGDVLKLYPVEVNDGYITEIYDPRLIELESIW